jgi:hypothetical protein
MEFFPLTGEPADVASVKAALDSQREAIRQLITPAVDEAVARVLATQAQIDALSKTAVKQTKQAVKRNGNIVAQLLAPAVSAATVGIAENQAVIGSMIGAPIVQPFSSPVANIPAPGTIRPIRPGFGPQAPVPGLELPEPPVAQPEPPAQPPPSVPSPVPAPEPPTVQPPFPVPPGTVIFPVPAPAPPPEPLPMPQPVPPVGGPILRTAPPSVLPPDVPVPGEPVPPGGPILVAQPPVLGGPVLVTQPTPPFIPPSGVLRPEPPPPSGTLRTEPPGGPVLRTEPPAPVGRPTVIPPDDEPTKCGLVQPGTYTGKPDDYCARLDALADYVGGLGLQILEALQNPQGLNADWVVPFGKVMLAVGHMTDSVYQRYQKVLAEVRNCGLIEQWVKGVANLYSGFSSRLLGLMAVDNCLMAWQAFTLQFAWHKKGDWTIKNNSGADLGTPKFIGTSIGTSTENTLADTDDYVNGMDLAVRVFIIPARELLSVLIRREIPTDAPSGADAVEALLRGAIDEKTAKCWANAKGQIWEEYRKLLFSRSEMLSAPELIQFFRRFDVDEQYLDAALKQRGWYRDDDREAVKKLYDQLPTVSDFLHWLQRNIFDTDYVRDFRLEEGFEERFWKEFGHDMRARGISKDVARHHYAAHWILPAPSQLAEMLRRLRPGRVDEKIQFTRDDYLRSLTEQDVAPFFRERFEAVAYSPFNFTTLLNLYDLQQLEDEDFRNRLEDIGYKHADALILQQGQSILRQRRRVTASRGYTPTAISHLFPVGLISEDDAREQLTAQGYSEQETTDSLTNSVLQLQAAGYKRSYMLAQRQVGNAVIGAYKLGTVSREDAKQALLSSLWTETSAEAHLGSIDASNATALVGQGVRTLHHGFIAGELNADDALAQLSLLGIVQERATQYVAAWTVERNGRRKTASTQQILRLVAEGMLSPVIARQRLLNLGWVDPDLMLLLAEAQQKLAEREARTAAAQLRSEKQRIAELERIARQAKSQHDSALAAIRRYRPMSEVKRQFVRGLVDDQYVRSYLTELEFPADEQDRILSDWSIDRAKWQQTH